MTRIEYDLLRLERPEFKLRVWENLWDHTQELILKLDRESFVSVVTAIILMQGQMGGALLREWL